MTKSRNGGNFLKSEIFEQHLPRFVMKGCVTEKFVYKKKTTKKLFQKEKKLALTTSENLVLISKIQFKMGQEYRHHSIPLEILDDLGSRFIINLPDCMRKDLIRICFQVKFFDII